MDTGIEPAPIAIVGMACRFPGDASDPDKLWQLLAGGKSAFKEIPQDRFNLAGFYHPDPKRSDSVTPATPPSSYLPDGTQDPCSY